jgi:hypothetical protein
MGIVGRDRLDVRLIPDRRLDRTFAYRESKEEPEDAGDGAREHPLDEQ